MKVNEDKINDLYEDKNQKTSQKWSKWKVCPIFSFAWGQAWNKLLITTFVLHGGKKVLRVWKW